MPVPAFVWPLVTALISAGGAVSAAKNAPRPGPTSTAAPVAGGEGPQLGPLEAAPTKTQRPPPSGVSIMGLPEQSKSGDLVAKEDPKDKLSEKDWNEILGATAAALQVAGPLLGLGPQQAQRVMTAPIPGGPAGGNVQFQAPRAQSLGELLAGLRVR